MWSAVLCSLGAADCRVQIRLQFFACLLLSRVSHMQRHAGYDLGATLGMQQQQQQQRPPVPSSSYSGSFSGLQPQLAGPLHQLDLGAPLPHLPPGAYSSGASQLHGLLSSQPALSLGIPHVRLVLSVVHSEGLQCCSGLLALSKHVSARADTQVPASNPCHSS